MKTVWKFTIPLSDVPTIQMPKGADILHVAEQHGKPCMWALVDSEAAKEPRHFRFAGTGHPIKLNDQFASSSLNFIGTFFMQDGALVFHIFEYVTPAGESAE